MKKNRFFLLATILLILASCSNQTPDSVLPFYGNHDVDVNGDTLFHTVEPFSFVNQDGEVITRESTGGEVYVVSYFFTHCPTMCPAMTGQMQRVRKAIPEITILTHTCDPERDTVGQLKYYVEKRGIDTEKWHFLTGSKSALYEQGFYSYLMSTEEDVLAPGGFLHSPYFVLIDREHHLRGMYDGTNTTEVDVLIEDVRKLINSYQ